MGAIVSIIEVLRRSSQDLLSDGLLQLVCFDQGLQPEDNFYELEERDRDLLLGRLYFRLYDISTGGTTEKVADGGWSHSESKQVSKIDIDKWAKLHKRLFEKWGEDILIPPSGIRLINL